MQLDDSILKRTSGVILFIFAFLLTFVVVEGLSSLILVVHSYARGSPLSERHHTRYDSELGWVSIPGLSIPNFYGPGIGLNIDSRGFRGKESVTPVVRNGNIRILCSGDSFTFGNGVDDRQTWCHILAGFDEHWESVNMGQAGYGLDQAYLWYMRDGAKLAASVHIFAFIVRDFYRMQSGWYEGYGKPVLKVKRGELFTTHVPVPESRIRRWSADLSYEMFSSSGLRCVNLTRRVINRILPARVNPDPGAHGALSVALRIFDTLAEVDKRKSIGLVLVYLPTQWDYYPNPQLDSFRHYLREAIKRKGITYFDLVDDLRTIPQDRLWEYFIPEGAVPHVEAAGHYSVKGNEWVAHTLYEQLLSTPSAARMFTFKKDRERTDVSTP